MAGGQQLEIRVYPPLSGGQDRDHRLYLRALAFPLCGEPHAEYMYKNDLCLEEYYALLQEEGIITYTTEAGVSYAIRFDQYNTSVNLPADELISVSRAYADSELGFIITTTVPQIELFDITGHWAEAYSATLLPWALSRLF